MFRNVIISRPPYFLQSLLLIGQWDQKFLAEEGRTSEHTSNVTGAQPRNNLLSFENQEYTGNQEYMGNKAKFRFGGCRMETEKA